MTDAELVTKGSGDHFLSVYAETFNARHSALPSRHYDTALCQVIFDVADVENHGILNGPEPSSFPTLNNRTFDSPPRIRRLYDSRY